MKNRNASLRVLLFSAVAALMLFSGVSQAQRIDQFTVSNFTGGYSTIVGSKGTTALYQLTSYFNLYSLQITWTLPIEFKYDNVTYPAGTTVYTSNGSFSFSNISSGFANVVNPTVYPGVQASTYPNRIAPLSGLQIFYASDPSGLNYPSTDNGGIYYSVTGVSPNRILTIEWNKMQDYGTSGAPASSQYKPQSYQLKMYEGTNMIEFIYEQYNAPIVNSSYQPNYFPSVGLNGNSSPSFIQVGLITSAKNSTSPPNNYRFSLAGNTQLALSPEAMDFGAQFTGVATQGLVTAKHAGTEGTLNLTSATISGPNASDFTIISGPTPSSSVAIGGSSTYAIRFLPTFGGPRTATLTVVSDGRDSGTQTISLTGFGIAPKINVVEKDLFKLKRVRLGDTLEQSIVIQSTGQASLYFTNYPNSFTFTGDNPGEYRVSKVPSNPLPAGASDTLKIKFIPTVEGARPATVNILSNAENSSSWPVPLKGIGVIPKIAVDKSLIDADSVAMGVTSCKKITVYNVGSDTLRILKHYFASKDGDYSYTPLPKEPYLIVPNDSVKIDICFTPMQKGTRVARFRILTDIPKTMQVPKQDTASIDINFSGNGVPVDLSIIAQKDVSDVVVGSEAGTPLEFTNVGTDPVVVTKPVISGANAAEFSVSKVNFPLTVAPGASVNMTLMSKPTARGERTANVLFNLTSDGRSYTASTVVKANALLACATSSVTSLAFDKLIIGESSANVFEVSNCGDVDQTFNATLSGSNAYSLDATSFVVPAGGKVDITVSFAPSAEGATTATLTLKGSHINDIAVNMTGVGEKKPSTASVGRTAEMDGFVLEQNAPNPALGYTNISFTSPKMATVRIYLADMTGKTVKEITSGNYSSGSHSVSLETKDLSSGSYIYILEAGNVRLTRQMIVSK
jgi:hypothetical protein